MFFVLPAGVELAIGAAHDPVSRKDHHLTFWGLKGEPAALPRESRGAGGYALVVVLARELDDLKAFHDGAPAIAANGFTVLIFGTRFWRFTSPFTTL